MPELEELRQFWNKMNLIKITVDEFDVELDLRYVSKNNIFGRTMYKKSLCYLHENAIKHLEKSIELAKKEGYRIKIWDGFRPFETQKIFYGLNEGRKIFSNPETGEIPHCRGIAIDLTLTCDGKELNMGTDFDDITTKACHSCKNISKEEKKNRILLKKIMIESEWNYFDREWWHYQLPNARDYPIISNNDLEEKII